MTKTTITYGRPTDRTYEAFVEFMDAMISKLAPDAKDTMTEEKKREYWQKFWAKADASKAK